MSTGTMTAPPPSLIEADKSRELFPAGAVSDQIFQDHERKGQFTGERFFLQRREDYARVVALSADGVGQIAIGEMLRVSPSTVRAVQRRERVAIGILKKGLQARALNVAELCAEELERRLGDPVARAKIPARDLAIIEGVQIERANDLGGFEVPTGDGSALAGADAAGVFADFFARHGVALGVGFGMGLAAGTAGQKGGLPCTGPGATTPVKAVPVAAGGVVVEVETERLRD